jgi:hypothetical protein
LRDAVELTLHGGQQVRHPLVVHHQRLNLGLGQFGVFGVYLSVEFLLRGLALGLSVRSES